MSGESGPPPESGGDSEWQDVYQDEVEEGDHDWHFRYNRRLSCFSHGVSSLAFASDGQYLVSGTGSGDVKVWDTSCWAEAGKFRGSRREEPRALVISPAQRWLVAAYAKVLHIFNFHPPWKLEQSLPSMMDPCTKEVSEWECIAFSPMAEVDHPKGHTGQDNNLAAFSTAHLCVLDYSGGWGEDAPRRMRSLMQSGKPTMLVYTACGSFMICGFASGQLQIWNTASLTHVKTLSAHTDSVKGLAASPSAAPYATRFVSCGVDQTLRVWHSQGWILEQHVHDTRCDRNGVRSCTFSANGDWLLSVAFELCVWRVNLSQRGRLVLTLHQRLSAVCGAEGLRSAAFSKEDAIAVGSRDGVLGLWVKYPGAPPDPADDSPPASPQKSSIRTEPWVPADRFARPMQKVTLGGIRPQPRLLTGGDWMQRTSRRSITMAMGAQRTILGNGNAVLASGRLVCNSPPGSSSSCGPMPARAMVRSATSMPDLNRSWRPTNRDSVLSNLGLDTRDHSRSVDMSKEREYHRPEMDSPVRKSMQHACRRGLVQRICLDPKVITDQIQDGPPSSASSA